MISLHSAKRFLSTCGYKLHHTESSEREWVITQPMPAYTAASFSAEELRTFAERKLRDELLALSHHLHTGGASDWETGEVEREFQALRSPSIWDVVA